MSIRNLTWWKLDEHCDFLILLVAGVPCGKGGRVPWSDFNTLEEASVVRARTVTFSVLEWELFLTEDVRDAKVKAHWIVLLFEYSRSQPYVPT